MNFCSKKCRTNMIDLKRAARNVYGREHRIILYHSQSLEKRRREKFMKRMDKVMVPY